ncbi:host cell division inhibitor Icd-like protein [Rodentibacter myodis]|uniref:Ash family protein n=1 Tax=Rodentibacter myodis TaxID=1907939 RepID=A0A1V3JKI9_9PAST|nr:host cell division inhibitor Icd-like protein [Rodentibacter myodis]OOF57320.1 hypothetical protein BKL49_09575 [Rodentibacter myodis]
MRNERAYYSQKSSTFHQTHKKSHILSNSALTTKTKLNYIKSALAKSEAGREKLNLQMANPSTPVFTRAFFVRSVRTPIQNNLSFDRLFPMVARNGQPLAVGCFPFVAVSHPVTRYRPIVRNLAVVPKNLQMETAEMIYKFLCVNRTHPHFNLCVQTIQANNETNARLSLSADFQCLSLIVKINPKFDRTFHQPHKKSRFLSNSALTVKTKLNYIKFALAKSKVRASKLVLLLQANSTPNRAFFVRSVYASIQYSLFSDSLFSMVAHNGKGYALCRFPVITVFEPVMCYRPSLETLAVVPQNLLQETAEMIYLFLCANRTRPTYSEDVLLIQADSEENARFQLTADHRYLLTLATYGNHQFNQAESKLNRLVQRLKSAVDFTVQGGIYA